MSDKSETLSEFVQRIMRQKSLSIRDVQKRASGKGDIAASYISRIFNGKVTNLTTNMIEILAEGLGVDPFEVFAVSCGAQYRIVRGIDPLRLLDIMQKAVAASDSLEILDGWLKLSSENQVKAKNYIRKLSPRPNSKKT